jgi:hypothetical protein
MIASGILILTSLFLQGCAHNVKGSLRKQVDNVEEIEKIEKKCERHCLKECERDCLRKQVDNVEEIEKIEKKCRECQKKCLEKEKECYKSTKYKTYLNQLEKNAADANNKYQKCKGDIIPFVKKEKCKQIAKKMKLRFEEAGRNGVNYPQCYRYDTRINWNESNRINNESSNGYDQVFGICKDTDEIGWKYRYPYKY